MFGLNFFLKNQPFSRYRGTHYLPNLGPEGFWRGPGVHLVGPKAPKNIKNNNLSKEPQFGLKFFLKNQPFSGYSTVLKLSPVVVFGRALGPALWVQRPRKKIFVKQIL